jgi:CysZ protein
MIFADFFRSIAQLNDARFRRVLLVGLGLTIALLIAVYAATLLAITTFSPDTVSLPFVGRVTLLKDLLSWQSVGFMILLSSFLMMPVASAFTSLFLDDVADTVEARHYPNLPRTTGTSWGDALVDTLNFLGLLVGANFLALFLYLAAPALMPVIFWGVNGYFLGREYFLLAARRRMDRKAAWAMFKANRGKIWFAGVLMAIPLSLPLVNLLVPVLGAATFTHYFQHLRGQRA